MQRFLVPAFLRPRYSNLHVSPSPMIKHLFHRANMILPLSKAISNLHAHGVQPQKFASLPFVSLTNPSPAFPPPTNQPAPTHPPSPAQPRRDTARLIDLACQMGRTWRKTKQAKYTIPAYKQPPPRLPRQKCLFAEPSIDSLARARRRNQSAVAVIMGRRRCRACPRISNTRRQYS